jgi:hypothetical protein
VELAGLHLGSQSAIAQDPEDAVELPFSSGLELHAGLDTEARVGACVLSHRNIPLPPNEEIPPDAVAAQRGLVVERAV